MGLNRNPDRYILRLNRLANGPKLNFELAWRYVHFTLYSFSQLALASCTQWILMGFKKNLYFAGMLLILAAMAVIYYQYNPAEYRLFPKCPFHSLTGLNCPGCGSQRAINHLLHGNFVAALHDNVLLIITLPFLLIHFYYKIKSAGLKKDLRWDVIYHPLTAKIIFVMVLVFWIARNIPVYPFSYLSPGY